MDGDENESSLPNAFEYDLGHLMVTDSNPVPPNATEAQIQHRSEICAQAIIHQLLKTCPIHTHEDKSVSISLPDPIMPIPREHPLPETKPKTTWEKFAEKKGIGKKDSRKETGAKVYDEATGEWVPKYGYRGKNKQGEDDWIVEVDDVEKEQQELAQGKTIRGRARRERKENVRRQQRKERANDRKSRKTTTI